MKLRKSVKLIVIAFGLVGLPAGAWWAWDAVNESRFRDALSRYREMGLPESVRDLQRALPAAEENAAFHYMAAIDKANELERIDPRSFTGSITPALRTAVGEAQAALAVLEEAATLPRCVYPHQWEDGLSMQPIRVGRLLDLGRLLAARARIRASDADLTGALSDVRVLFRAGASLAEEPFLLQQIIRMSIAGLAFDTLEEILPLCKSPTEALDHTRPDVVRGAMERGLRSEAMHLATLYSPEFDPRTLDLGSGGPAVWLLRCRAVTSPYVNGEATLALDFMSRRVAALSRPYHEAIPAVEALAREIDAEKGLLNELIMLNVGGMLKREAKVSTRAKLATLAARCISYRLQHGVFPDTLTRVADEAELDDPLTGGAFALSREQNDVVIASARGEVSWRIPGE